MLIVLVRMLVSAEHYQLFKPLLANNAQLSLTESECYQFDIGERLDTETQHYEFVLYEKYQDHKAFDFHLTTFHFLDFDSQTADMIIEKEVKFFDLVEKK